MRDKVLFIFFFNAPHDIYNFFQALFRRALVKYGPNFTDIAMMIGTKTYTIVKDYYKQLGGGKTKWIKPLLQAHTRLKRTNQLDSWSTELSAEEEEAIKLGKLSTSSFT